MSRQRTLSPALRLLVTATVAGCAGSLPGGHLPAGPPLDPGPPAVRAAGAVQAAGENAPGGIGGLSASTPAIGRVFLAVRWPRSVQVLPYSTKKVLFSILSPEGSPLATASVNRDGTRPVASASLAVPASLVTVKAEAFDSTASELVEPIADASAELQVEANGENQAILELSPRFVPFLSPPQSGGGPPSYNAGDGGLLTLLGGNFGASRNTAMQVLVGGTTVSAVTRDDAKIDLVVPAGAGNGWVQVISDGVPSATFSFQLLGQLQLVDSPGTMSAGSTASLPVSATDVTGAAISVPNVAWWVRNEPQEPGAVPLATVSYGGGLSGGLLLAGDATGTVVVTVFSGNVAATAAIEIE